MAGACGPPPLGNGMVTGEEAPARLPEPEATDDDSPEAVDADGADRGTGAEALGAPAGIESRTGTRAEEGLPPAFAAASAAEAERAIKLKPELSIGRGVFGLAPTGTA